MELSDKIKLILSYKEISPSLFADEVGIQRSSMSHILSGRNKPSLEIVQKIIKRYPDLGVSWILDGEELSFTAPGTGENVSKQESREAAKVQTVSPAQPAVSRASELQKQPENEVADVKPKMVDKIIVFYSDGTFQELRS
ncbi:helix-turn-helix transcriptional regulator [Dyadobacter sandarakinus]|uniref:Helix-turn-helix transcriptional regulator n=1 Tax=Dyadobacter sandarakinus TaxID=2747268 RepID=A0ABX7I2Y7_9BACT|nr:helix-turn-helix transcriptional regulator [Dyadobacter sandarakinus]QRR00451.1 helix-turn-helix transcriptional regulator [Dyadobacter sandarakinus]